MNDESRFLHDLPNNDLHVFHKPVMPIRQHSKDNLRNDSADLATTSRDAMSSGTVSRREYFARNDKSRHIRPKILEEVGKTVNEEKGLLRSPSCVKLVVRKTCANSPINWVDIL